MQSVSSRIWTRVAMSISYDDNHYTTGTFLNIDFISVLSFVSVLVKWNRMNNQKIQEKLALVRRKNALRIFLEC